MAKKEKPQIKGIDGAVKEIDGILYVPFVTLEAHEARHTKERRNIIIAFLVAIVLIIGIVFAYESQFTTVDEVKNTEYSYSQDGEGFNNINTGTQGDKNGAEISNTDNGKEKNTP